MNKNKIKIISRNSQLAMWQANFVAKLLEVQNPQIDIEIIGVTTTGDRILDKTLDKIGGKGLFIKELENQLLSENVDLAVHSLKDLPASLDDRFKLAAILKREDPRDAFVSNNYDNLASMPKGAVIGTSSARRIAILKRHYKDLTIKLLRGNLTTRLNKLDNGEFDAIILAVAGLKRLGLDDRIKQALPENVFIPAIGQGALAIEILSSRSDLVSLLEPLNHENTLLATSIERMVGHRLNVDCSSPVAVYAKIEEDALELTAMLVNDEHTKYNYSKVNLKSSDYLDAINLCVDELCI